MLVDGDSGNSHDTAECASGRHLVFCVTYYANHTVTPYNGLAATWPGTAPSLPSRNAPDRLKRNPSRLLNRAAARKSLLSIAS